MTNLTTFLMSADLNPKIVQRRNQTIRLGEKGRVGERAIARNAETSISEN
ncbi:MAG: hypothetical protein AAF191_07895 [Verrucomicrobiota bacterium]